MSCWTAWIAIAGVALACAAGGALADDGKNESGKGRGGKDDRPSPTAGERDGHQGRRDDDYFRRRGYARLDIPRGHYPPPGECRIWLPDRPPGRQGPPGPCERLSRDVPPGAWLLRRSTREPERVQVIVYEAYDDHGRHDHDGGPAPGPLSGDRRRSGIRVVGEFDIGTGGFLRVVLDHDLD